MAATVAATPHGPLDLVIDPLLVSQCRDLADGYRTADGTEVSDRRSARPAANLSALLSAVTAEQAVETVATPYANPLLPAMFGDYPRHLGRSSSPAQRARPSSSALGAAPITTVAKPAGGQLSDDVLDWLARARTTRRAGGRRHDRRSADTGLPRPRADGPDHDIVGTATLVQPDPDIQALFDRFDLSATPSGPRRSCSASSR